MTRREYCCASFAGKPEEKLAAHFYDRAEAWYAAHPIAVGVCDPKEARKRIRRHEKECRQAVRDEYVANAAAVDQACGIFEPFSWFSLIVFLIRLFYDWTHERTEA